MAIDDIWIENGVCPSFERCDFEINNCMWKNDIRNEVNWTRKTGDDGGEPNIDHNASSKGTFLYFDATYNHGSGASGRIISEILVPKITEKCLKFWYYLAGNLDSHLKVYIKVNSTMHLIWGSRGKWYGNWYNGSVPLNEKEPYQIVIEGVHGQSSSYYEGLALDDIGITEETCEIFPASSDPSDFADTLFNCDFETSFCNWNNDVQWKLGKSYKVFQPITNNKGNYIYLDSAASVVHLESPVIPGENPDQHYCFKFLYYMFGPHVGNIKLYEIDNEAGNTYLLWQRIGSQADKWFNGVVNIHRIGRKLKLMFEVTDFDIGVIALDEISVSTDDCDHGYICDFESSSCGWAVNPNQWHFGNGSLAAKNPEYPANDHTTLSPSGFFLWTRAESPKQNITYLMTPLYPAGFGTQCLKFWFYIGGDSDASLTVSLMSANENVTGWDLWSARGTYNKIWHYGHVTVQSYAPTHVVFVITSGEKGFNIVALDDVELEPGPCPLHGICTFDNGMCGYKTEKLLSESKWLEGFGRTWIPSEVIGPVEDHTSGEGFYMYVDFTNPITNLGSTATLVSDHYRVYTNKDPICLQFYYLAIGSHDNSLEVQVRVKGNQSTSLWQSPVPSPGMTWNCTSLPFTESELFEVVFIAKKTDTNSFVGIDDVSVYISQNCTCLPPSEPPPTVVPSNSTYFCDFEKGDTCLWIDEGYEWTIKDSNSYHFVGPKYDHTTNRYKGKYIYVNSDDYSLPVAARLSSPALKRNDLYCLKFWYFMHGSKTDTLQVLLHNSKLEKTVWKRNITEGLTWRYAQVEIEKSMNYQVTFEASTGKSYEGIIGLDDIDIVDGNCPPQKICTFDEDDWCGFSNDPQYGTFWTLTPRDGLPDDSLFPDDHTSESRYGRYIYLNTSNYDASSATLVSHVYPKTEKSCIKFWHFMRSPDYLEVYINDNWQPALLLEDDVFTETWNGIMVPVSSPTEWQFKITGLSEASEDFIMAIDDIEVTLDQPCDPEGYCDFEAGTCMWQNGLQNDYDWTRESAIERQANWGTYGPPVDHTNYSPAGYYMLLEEGSYGYGSVLLSRLVKTTDALCISFWYYTNRENSFNIEVDVIERYNPDGDLIGSTSPDVANKWIQASFDNPAYYEYVQFRIWAKDASYNDYLAIDDITFHKMQCADIVPSKFQCKDGTNITMDKVCDFKRDCSDGSDEANCGNCDFEDGTCNYSDIGNGDFQWVRNDEVKSVIQTDHNNNSSGHFMLADFKNSKYYNDEAHLMSPAVQFSYPSCVLTFWYYSSVIADSREALNVYLVHERSEDSVLIWQSNRHGIENRWLQGNVSIGRIHHPFAVNFAASGPYLDEVMAIDDIEFLHCEPPKPAKDCPKENLNCSNAICIDKSRVCDFVDDCGDEAETDENNCDSRLRCDFEDSICNWDDISDSNNQWERFWTAYGIYGPDRDHTLGTNKGNFIFTQAGYMYGKSRLVSPILKPKSGCQLRFYYYMFGSVDMNLRILLRTYSNGIETSLWEKAHSAADYFVRKVVSLNETTNFQIIIEGDAGNNVANVIALDDLSFDPDCEIDYTVNSLPIAPPGPCPSGQFQCKSGECITDTYQCNFHLDCSDGSDEDSCADCDFDNGLCGWKESSDGAYEWVRQESTFIAGLKGTFPSGDHTSGTGELMMVQKTDKGDIKIHPVTLMSPKLVKTAPSCVMDFWYHRSNLSGKIDILLIHDKNPTVIQVTSLENSNSISWNHQQIRLGLMKAGIQVEFQATVSKDNKDDNVDLLLDDIRFNDCYLPGFKPTDEDLACNFENGLCTWYQEYADDDLNWNFGNGKQHVKGTGPEFDHSKNDGTGYYIYLESKKSSDESDLVAWIVSAAQSPKQDDYCLQFYYHMFGIHIDSLNVYIRLLNSSDKQIIWSRKYSQGNTWRQGQRTIHPQDQPFQIIFEAKQGKGKKGDIALDDISWNKYACHEPQRFCDFESDLCDWSYITTSDLNWIRGPIEHTIGYGNPLTGPSEDHTTGSSSGHYVFMKPNTLDSIASGKSATFISSEFPGSTTKQCFKFWYYLSGDNKIPYASFNVTIKNSTEKQLRTYTSLNSIWQSDSLTFESAEKYQIKITGLLWSGKTGTLALDDLEVKQEACLPRGSCHFSIEQQDMCDWFNAINQFEDDLDWMLASGKTPSDFTGPETDHSGSTEGSYIFLEAAEAQSGSIAILRSPELIEDVACFTLWYHMYGDDIGELKVVLWTAPFSSSSLVTVFEIKGNQGNNWNSKSITLQNIPLPYRIEIWGIIGNGTRGDIAVDDFDFVSGSCLPSSITTPQITTSSTSSTGGSITTSSGVTHAISKQTESITSTPSSSSVTPPGECPVGFLSCKTKSNEYKGCLPGILQCDGYQDCEDGSDEPEGCIVCEADSFFCNNTDKPVCLKASAICNLRQDCDDQSDESICDCEDAGFCLNEGKCALDISKPLACSCADGYSGNRCQMKLVIENKEKKEISKGWIAGVVVVIVIAVVAGVGFLYYRRKRSIASPTPRAGISIENPVYERTTIDDCQDFAFGDANTSLESLKDVKKKNDEEGTVNPLYGMDGKT